MYLLQGKMKAKFRYLSCSTKTLRNEVLTVSVCMFVF